MLSIRTMLVLVVIAGTAMSWEDVSIPNATFALRDVSFVSPEVGWVAGDGGAVYKTVNGGDSWIKQSPFTNDECDVQAVDFINPQVGWIATEGGYIYKTSDGGDEWVEEYHYDEEYIAFRDLEMSTLFDGWACGQRGAASGIIFQYGMTGWHKEMSGGHYILEIYSHGGQTNVFRVGDNDLRKRVLVDPGPPPDYLWRTIIPGVFRNIDFCHPGSLLGWATYKAGFDGYYTMDGGMHWSEDISGFKASDVTCIDTSELVPMAWGIDQDGYIINSIYSTITGEWSDWAFCYNPQYPINTICSVEGPDGSAYIYAVGNNGGVYKGVEEASFRYSSETEANDYNSCITSARYVGKTNGQVQIEICLAQDSDIHFRIYDVTGRLLTNIYPGTMQTGTNNIYIDTVNDAGEAMHPGVYLCNIEAGNEQTSLPFVLLK
ncbi:MAG: hypothetical protein K8R76_03325 [Candidatus Aegiribacteria sp.]|nr:hypothetical protein [Candidatus Aegiribacteria sp.]